MKLVEKPWGLVLRRSYLGLLSPLDLLFGMVLSAIALVSGRGPVTFVVVLVLLALVWGALNRSLSRVEVDRRRRELRLVRSGVYICRVPFGEIASLFVERAPAVGWFDGPTFRHYVVCRDGRTLPFFIRLTPGDLPVGTSAEFEHIAASMRKAIGLPLPS